VTKNVFGSVRFRRSDVAYIADLISWENALDDHGRMRTAHRRYRVDPIEATAILVRRLSMSSRWADVQDFGKHSSALTEIFYHTLELFYEKFFSTIQDWPGVLIQERAQYYGNCIAMKGYPLPNVVGLLMEQQSK
jgi:hypothetical protein